MTENPGATLHGTVEKIMKSANPGEPESAQIHIEGTDRLCQEIRIENKLIDENNEAVQLKPGAKVQLTVRSRATGNHDPGK